MRLGWISMFVIAAVVAASLPGNAHAQVHDNAGIFSKDAIQNAERDMRQMERTYHKQFVVETFSSVPADKKAALAEDSEKFFLSWEQERASALGVNGVYALICMDPKHLEITAGKETRALGLFTAEDRKVVRDQMLADMKAGQFDSALRGAVESVNSDYGATIHRSAGHTSVAQNVPQSPVTTPPPLSRSEPVSHGLLSSVGTLICLGVGAVIIISIVRSVLRGSNSGGGNYGGNQGYTGGNYGGGGGGYGNSGMMGGGGGSGSGFGKGFLGGLLGGAIGGYAADKFDHRNDQSNTGFFGGGQQSDNSGGSGGGGGGDSGGGSFDSGPSDAGQGFGDSSSSSGGDFGGGGGDSGGGGSDSGSSGGDF